MNTIKNINKTALGKAEALLLLVVALRSTSLLFATKGLAYMGPLTMNGLRFPLAFLILIFVFRKEISKIDRKTLLHGCIIGFFFFMTMAMEMLALQNTSSSMTSFLENTTIMIIPIINAVMIRKLPKKEALISSAIALVGVGFLTLKGGQFSLSIGEIYCLATALFYSGTIIATDRYSKEDNPALLGFIQVGFIAVASFVTAFVIERPELPTAPEAWGVLLFLAIVCTCLGFTLQPVAQSKVTTEFAAMSCALNPLITAVLGYSFLGERLGINGLIGGACIVVSILVSAILDNKRKTSPEKGLVVETFSQSQQQCG